MDKEKNKNKQEKKQKRKQKKKGSRRNQAKSNNGKNNKKKQAINLKQSTSSCNLTCLTNAMTYLKLMKDNVGNYLRQDKRFRAVNKTGGKKSGKKGLFGPVLQRILEAGGGNKSQLTCAGEANNSGAKTFTNLTATLIKCEDNINMSCNTANFPLPNMTKVDSCVTTMKSFKSLVDGCMNTTTTPNASSACTCWNKSSFTSLATEIRTCQLSSQSKAMVLQLKYCKANFSACKTAEDDSLKAISACSVSTSGQVAKAAALTANIAGVTAANTTAASLAGTSSGKFHRASRASVTTCAEVITINKLIIKYSNQKQTSDLISTNTAKVTKLTGITCTTTEKTTLTSQITSFIAILVEMASTLTTAQSDIKAATGSTASSATIANATSATATSANRRNMMAEVALAMVALEAVLPVA